jgi:hypothetical protein
MSISLNYFFVIFFNIFFVSHVCAMYLKDLGRDFSESERHQELAALVKRLDQWEKKRVRFEEEYREFGMGRLLKELEPDSRINLSLHSSGSLKKVVVMSVSPSLRKKYPLSRSNSSYGSLRSRRSSWNSMGSDFMQQSLIQENICLDSEQNKENNRIITESPESYKKIMDRKDIVYHGLFARIENIEK